MKPASPEPQSDGCIICLDEMDSEQELKQLECSHRFHKECITKWFETKRSRACPVCRSGEEPSTSPTSTQRPSRPRSTSIFIIMLLSIHPSQVLLTGLLTDYTRLYCFDITWIWTVACLMVCGMERPFFMDSLYMFGVMWGLYQIMEGIYALTDRHILYYPIPILYSILNGFTTLIMCIGIQMYKSYLRILRQV